MANGRNRRNAQSSGRRDGREVALRDELRALEGAIQQLEARGRRAGGSGRSTGRRGTSRLDKLVSLLNQRPDRDWYVDEMVGELRDIAGRASEARKKEVVRQTIGQAQQRGLIRNTGRTRYRLTASGRSHSGAAVSNNGRGSDTAHVNRAIAALRREERAISGELQRLGRSVATRPAARAPRATSRPAKRVRRSDGGTQVEQLITIIGRRPDKEWSIEDMMDALVSSGWDTSSKYPEQIVRNNVTHAVNRGLVRRVSRGRYRLR
ncbi:MAG TPA: hypothetical protein VEJ87_06500, partial [Acidimicrobiales bacterium]|nr:hypothetical protein [Acidimicrobiales bacterium]